MQTVVNNMKDKVTQVQSTWESYNKYENEKELVSTRDRWYPKLLVEEASKHMETTYKRYELLD